MNQNFPYYKFYLLNNYQPNIFNRGLMNNLSKYFDLIRSLAKQIRYMQVQNGFSQEEINLYLTNVMQKQLSLSSCITHSFDSIFASIFRENKQQLQGTLVKIIQVLEIQLCSLSFQPTNIEQSIKNQQIKVQKLSTSKFEFITQSDTNEKKELQFVTPRQKKLSRLRDWYKETQNTNNQLDQIQKSIQQTLERTRKLKKYLQFKTGQQKERERQQSIQKSIERSIERQIERSIQRSIDRSVEKSIEGSSIKEFQSTSRIKFERSLDNFQSIFID